VVDREGSNIKAKGKRKRAKMKSNLHRDFAFFLLTFSFSGGANA
jgi:hypothetical protein